MNIMETIKNYSKKTVESYTIDYKNGVYCDVIKEDGDITWERLYCYIGKKREYLEFIKDISIFQNSHWSNHYEMLEENHFDGESFDDLYIVGGGHGGTLRDRFGKILTSLQYIDDVIFNIHTDIKTKEGCEVFVEKIKDISWVKDIEIVEVPYYNCLDENIPEWAVKFSILPPQYMIDEYVLLTKANFWDSAMKESFLDYLIKFTTNRK
jgi:hypothetical protein